MLRSRPRLRMAVGVVMVVVAVAIFVMDGIRIASVGFLVAGILQIYTALTQ